MSYIDNLKAIIAANIYTNGNQEVTAAMVKAAANAIVDMLFPQTDEDGWFLVDEYLNIALKYDADGLDAAKVSDHFKSLLGGAAGDFIQVLEDGVYFVDSSYNIGAFLDADGLHAQNILQYEML